MFAHAFLTLEWNLLARSDNCFQMNINHIEWRDDCMVFFLPSRKEIKLEKVQKTPGMFTRIQTIPKYVQS